MLQPVAHVSPASLARGQHHLVQDLAWASFSGSFAGWLVDHAVGGSRVNAYALCFGIAAATGFISSWHLARAPEPQMGNAGPTEGREVSERQVAQAFALEAWRSLNALSSTALGALFPFERLSERRKWWRGREAVK